MNDYIYKWYSNGWVNSRGLPVANQDLIMQAWNLDDEVKTLGNVRYTWIPKSANKDADWYCKEVLDKLE